MMDFVDAPMFGATGQASSQTVVDDPMTGGQEIMDMGSPHLALAGWIILALGLKYAGQKVFTLNPQEMGITLHNVLAVTFMAGAGIVGLKVLSAKLLQAGVMVPGFHDLVGAL